MLSNSHKRVIPILFTAFIAVIFIYIWIFGVNILYLDEWTFVPLVRDAQTNGISFDILFRPHNEHRLFFPNLFYLGMLPISHMNSKFFMYINGIMLCIVFLGLFLIAKKQFSFSLANIPVWIILIPLFVFNFRQSQNLLWGFQIAFYMVLTFTVWSLFLLEKTYSASSPYLKALSITGAVLFAIIATFSSAMGAMVWFAGVVQILIKMSSGNKRHFQNWLYFLCWVIIGSIAILIYYSGIQGTIKQDLLFQIKHPFTFVHFFFCLISLTSVHSLSIIAFPIGIIIFLISIFVLYRTYRNRRLRENSFWIALYVFSLMFSIITTIGRSPHAFEYTDRARYTIFTSLLTLSAFIMFYDNYRISSKRNEDKLFQFFAMGLILLALELNAIGLAFGIKEKGGREKFREVVLNYKTQSVSNELKNEQQWISDPEFLNMVDQSVPFLDKNHYNVFINKK
jgi:hypothetical protein